MNQVKTSEHTVSITEAGANHQLRPLVLLNLLQDIAEEHALRIGIGMEDLAKKGFVWFAAKYHIRVERYPQWQEKVTMRSWLSGQQKLLALRDFQVVDSQDTVIISASSGWLVIDIDAKKPRRPDRSLGEVPYSEQRALNTRFNRLPDVEAADIEKTFWPMFNQIDQNDHVNSTAYLMWALETMPDEIMKSHHPVEIEIAFKNETLYGHQVTAKTQIAADGDSITATHVIINLHTNEESARIRTVWKRAS
jgi:medium-chain acyl-[acyl-carrier-protein] hydrolase